MESKEFNRGSAISTPQAASAGEGGLFGTPAVPGAPTFTATVTSGSGAGGSVGRGGTRAENNRSGFFLGGKQKRQPPTEDAVKRDVEQQKQVAILTTKVSNLERSLGHLNEMVYMLLNPEQQQQIMRNRIASLHAHQQRQMSVKKKSIRGKGTTL